MNSKELLEFFEKWEIERLAETSFDMVIAIINRTRTMAASAYESTQLSWRGKNFCKMAVAFCLLLSAGFAVQAKVAKPGVEAETWEAFVTRAFDGAKTKKVAISADARKELLRAMKLVESEDFSIPNLETTYGLQFSSPAKGKFGEFGGYEVRRVSGNRFTCKPASIVVATGSATKGASPAVRIAGKTRRQVLADGSTVLPSRRVDQKSEELVYPLDGPGFDGGAHYMHWYTQTSSLVELQLPVAFRNSESTQERFRWAANPLEAETNKRPRVSSEAAARIKLFASIIRGRKAWSIQSSILGALEGRISEVSEANPEIYVKYWRAQGRPWESRESISSKILYDRLIAAGNETELVYTSTKGQWRIRLNNPISELPSEKHQGMHQSRENFERMRLSPPCGQIVITKIVPNVAVTATGAESPQARALEDEAEFIKLTVEIAAKIATSMDPAALSTLGVKTAFKEVPRTQSGKVWMDLKHPALASPDNGVRRTSALVGDLNCSYFDRPASAPDLVAKTLGCKPELIRSSLFLAPLHSKPGLCVKTEPLLRKLAERFVADWSPGHIPESISGVKASDGTTILSGSLALSSVRFPMGPTPVSVSRTLGRNYYDSFAPATFESFRTISPQFDLLLQEKNTRSAVALELYTSGKDGGCVEMVALGKAR